MSCKQDMLHSSLNAMVFDKANNEGFVKEVKPISPFVMEKARIQSLSISNFKEQLYSTLYAKQDMSDFTPYLIFPGEIPV